MTYLHNNEITYENVKGETRITDKCGVNLLLYFIIYLLPALIILTPSNQNIAISLGYSIILNSVYFLKNRITDVLLKPIEGIGRLIQKHLSTSEPDDRQVFLAIAGIKRLITYEKE